jgi:anaphase-promoting complex subunit 8
MSSQQNNNTSSRSSFFHSSMEEASTNMSMSMSMSMDTTGMNTTADQSILFQTAAGGGPTATAAVGSTATSPSPVAATAAGNASSHNQHQHLENNSNSNNNNVTPSANREREHNTNNNNNNAELLANDSWDVEDARVALRKAVQMLSHRGLKLASKWAAEQLIGLAPPNTSATTGNGNRNFDFKGVLDSALGVASTTASASISLNEGGNDLELYAKSILDLGEYHRAAAVLSVNPTIDSISSEDNNNNKSNNNSSSNWANADADTRRSIGKAKSQGGDLGIQPPRKNLTSYGTYLRAYALYMAGERRKEEEVLELRDPLERTTVTNSYLSQLASELHSCYMNGNGNSRKNNNNSNTLDGFGLYIYGVVLKEIQKSPTSSNIKSSPRSTVHGHMNGQRYEHGYGHEYPHGHQNRHHHSIESPTAQSILIQSLIAYPYNWSAWLDLAEICIMDPSIHPEVEAMLKPISAHWMYHFFCVHLFLENQANENAIMVMERLIHGAGNSNGHGNGASTNEDGFFVSSPYLQSQLAVAHYNMRDYDTAQTHFTMSSDRDPHRLDQMDVYSNILYVKEDKVALSTLAHRAVKLDKYRPETCCIVGNYYSLKAQHEKAVFYFQRALKLDRSYLSAWTLMGHEYLEMKNTAAAIEAYRRAVDINSNDYRAWYGLGQTYEIMNMLLYALFYYQKAVELRPYDPRMWCAMGGCYLGLERRSDAMRSYERAVANHDAEGIATKKLATLYREDGDSEKAARCYLRHLELRYQAQLSQSSMSTDGATVEVVISSVNVDEPEAEALLNLASYHRDNGKFEMASLCCSRLLDYPGPEKELAKGLLREIRSILDKNQMKTKKAVTRNESFEFSP